MKVKQSKQPFEFYDFAEAEECRIPFLKGRTKSHENRLSLCREEPHSEKKASEEK